jgi:hypothetical protein
MSSLRLWAEMSESHREFVSHLFDSQMSINGSVSGGSSEILSLEEIRRMPLGGPPQCKGCVWHYEGPDIFSPIQNQ